MVTDSLPLLPGGLFLGRRTQNRPNKNPSGQGNLLPRNWPNSKNAAKFYSDLIKKKVNTDKLFVF
jgi:hypothetical protein